MYFVRDDTADPAGGINPVYPFDLPALFIELLQVVPVSIAWITEVDTAF